MEKLCINCKYCNYNQLKKEYEDLNFWKKLFSNLPLEIKIAKNNPKCNHPEVYYIDNKNEKLVYGTVVLKKMRCKHARYKSFGDFKCCGEEGKYFEADTNEFE